MFITGSQLFSIFCSAFTVLRGLIGPLSYILTVTYIEGLKIIFVFNMSTLNCSYIIHFLIIFHFARVNMESNKHFEVPCELLSKQWWTLLLNKWTDRWHSTFGLLELFWPHPFMLQFIDIWWKTKTCGFCHWKHLYFAKYFVHLSGNMYK